MAQGKVTFKMKEFTVLCEADGIDLDEFSNNVLEDPSMNDLEICTTENLEIVKVEEFVPDTIDAAEEEG